MHRRLARSLTAAAVPMSLLMTDGAFAINHRDKVALDQTAYCIYEEAVLQDPTKGDPRLLGILDSYKGNCSTTAKHATGWLAQGFWLLYSSSYDGKQGICRASKDWSYNTKPTSSFTVNALIEEPPPCKEGWYETRAFGWLYYNDKWVGGYVNSGRYRLT